MKKKIITVLLFFISLTIMISGIRLYGIGFHNYDLGFNLKTLGLRFNTTLVDTNTDFEKWNPNTIIITGAKQIDTAFSLSLFGAILLGFAIGDIHYGRR